MKLGVAKSCITPEMPVRLCGYAKRKGTFEGVLEDIYIRVHWQENDGIRLVLVYGDLLWWGTDFVEKAKNELWCRLGLKAEEIFFIASHNHSGPPTGNLFTEELETYSPEYARQLLTQVVQTVGEAGKSLEKVTIKRYDGEAALNVYRRLKWDGIVEMRPNYKVRADHQLTVIHFQRLDGTIKGRWIHYPCHANLSSDNQIHGDYPGVLLRKLDEKTPGCISMFLQGFTGDLRPNCTLGDRFISADWSQVQCFAEELEEAVERIEKKTCRIVEGYLTLKQMEVPLRLENIKSEEWLEQAERFSSADLERQWAGKVLEKGNKDFENLQISSIRYGDSLCVFLFNAEVSQFYGTDIKQLFPDAICVGYANGMIGYVMTEQQIKDGGYEPDESAKYFALSGTYSSGVEKKIKAAIQSMKD